MKAKARKANPNNTKITFTQLEKELGFDIVNSIFGFYSHGNKDRRLQLPKEARYFFASLLFTDFVVKDKFLADLKTYFRMIHNETAIEWKVIVNKYVDHLISMDYEKLLEYANHNNYTKQFEIS